METQTIKERVQKLVCYRCGRPLESAKVETISNTNALTVAHAICGNCKAESLVTVTSEGTGIAPIISDLNVTEFKKFLGATSISLDDVFNIHSLLKRNNICNLLAKKEKYSAKRRRA